MKNMAIVCNIGHFDREIQIAGAGNMKWTEIKPQVDEVEFPDGKKIIVLAGRPPGEPGLRHGSPELRDDRQLHQPGAGPDRTVDQQGQVRQSRCFTPAQASAMKVAFLHLEKLGAEADQALKDQAAYIGVPQAGPFKPDHYRY